MKTLEFTTSTESISGGKAMKNKLFLFCILFLVAFELFSINSYAASPSVSYCSHVATVGWQNMVSDGKTSGTVGKSLRIETVKMKLTGISGGIQYRTYVQGKGWTKWSADGIESGTTGKGLRIEAIQIKLTGSAVKKYDIYD